MITLITVAVKDNLEEALRELAEHDADFCGENGDEYLWEETREAGFETNLDFVLDEIKDTKDDEEKINEFIERWILSDNYYKNPEYQIITKNYEVRGIAIAYEY